MCIRSLIVEVYKHVFIPLDPTFSQALPFTDCLLLLARQNLPSPAHTHPNLVQAAYLALTQFLDHNSELVLLLVNTLLSDLKSDNYLIGEFMS